MQFLRDARTRGLGDFLDEQLQSAPREVVARLGASSPETSVPQKGSSPPSWSLPDWLRAALASVPGRKQIPDWVMPSTLPVIHVAETVIPEENVEAVLRALMASTLEAPAPLVQLLAEKGDRASLETFAWALFERWLNATAPSKDRWAFLALAPFGCDSAAAKLAPMIRVWPGESQHQRAVVGLDVLRIIGTDAALQALDGLAQRLKFKALQTRAIEMMDLIATKRGLTREQLGDRIVPDLGLALNGEGRVFDYGPRSFTVVLSPALELAIRNDTGRVLKDLPAAVAGDEAAKVSAAQAEWKLLKKQMRETLKIQIDRLEQALVVGRRWSPTDFMTFLVQHPLMSRLGQRLLWAGYDNGGKRVQLFRLTGEGICVDVKDQPCSLKEMFQVGLPHPLPLSEEEKTEWTRVFAKNDLKAPFPQLNREIHTLPADQMQGRSFRPDIGTVPGIKLRSRLEGGGWRRVQHDQGGIIGFNKPFEAAKVTAALLIDGCIVLGYPSEEEIGVERVLFVSGTNEPYNTDVGDRYRPHYVRQGKQMVQVDPGLPLNNIDPVVLSEVLRDLTEMAR